MENLQRLESMIFFIVWIGEGTTITWEGNEIYKMKTKYSK